MSSAHFARAAWLFACLAGTLATPALADSEVFVSVCARQAPFQVFLITQLQKTCDQITAEEVRQLATPGRTRAVAGGRCGAPVGSRSSRARPRPFLSR